MTSSNIPPVPVPPALLAAIDAFLEAGDDPELVAKSKEQMKKELCEMGHKQYCKDIVVA